MANAVIAEGWDLANVGTLLSGSPTINSEGVTPTGVYIKPDGTQIFILFGGTSEDIHAYNLSTPYDSTTKSATVNTKNFGGQQSLPTDLWFKPDGTKVYISGNGSGNIGIKEFSLSTPWDCSTINLTPTASLSTVAIEESTRWHKDVFGWRLG